MCMCFSVRERIHVSVVLRICASWSTLFINYIIANKREKKEIFTMSSHTWTHQTSVPRPTFSFCGNFSGKEGISAARWLKRLEWEFEPSVYQGNIPPKDFLKSVDLLLTEEAAAWADTSEEVSSLLSLGHPSVQDVTRFKSLFQAKFPAKSCDSTSTSLDFELRNLVQMKHESLRDYYHRVLAMMHRFGAKDRVSHDPYLTKLESTVLDMIMEAFIKGLSDHSMQRVAIERTNYGRLSLADTYNMIQQQESSSKSEVLWRPVNTPASNASSFPSHIPAHTQQHPESQRDYFYNSTTQPIITEHW